MVNRKFEDGKSSSSIVPKTVLGVPKYVNHDADLRPFSGFHTDSWFVVTKMKGDDSREFSFLIHFLALNPSKKAGDSVMSITISLADKTNRQYIVEENIYPIGHFSISTEKFDIQTPVASISGALDKMVLSGALPENRGKVEVTLERVGPVLDNCATGAFPWLSNEVTAWHYALPHLKAIGTLTLGDKPFKISGDAWLDRQWGDTSGGSARRWKWMNLNLDNGYRISLWDTIIHGKNENAFATVLSPDGAHTVVDMIPLAKGESEFYVSPVTNQKYPIHFVVEIPSLDTKLLVKAYDGIPNQEIVGARGNNRYEGACTFTGKFMGKKVSGWNYVELVGNYR